MTFWSSSSEEAAFSGMAPGHPPPSFSSEPANHLLESKRRGERSPPTREERRASAVISIGIFEISTFLFSVTCGGEEAVYTAELNFITNNFCGR